MIFKYILLALSIPLMLNSAAFNLIYAFAPSKSEIRFRMIEGNTLDYPCQYHGCDCTKETCFDSCCCIQNHEVFEELVKKKDSCCDNPDEKVEEDKKQLKVKTSVIDKMICKKDLVLDNEFVLIKKLMYFLTETTRDDFCFRDQEILVQANSFCNAIKTQTTIQPENPPPNFS